ncbi:MAG: ABC transporter ATP-binding protein [Ferruginibacter sp.]
MTDSIIEVSNISKLYKLGTIGSGSLKRDLYNWWNTAVRKKEQTYDTIMENTDMDSQYLWALKDISFKIKDGEALGIIGSNGSGKSTLLKIISKIVQPTRGTITGRGRISSILEVGTGFHAELTGRENIYISGYTLGMSKFEIIEKFDEIVAFSGIEKFLDTPVKRYSSGMYVRLAFAVAAHLEPDILIVDEVLAVGDADFQKKCMGKMKDISNKNGRTILFVSHNLQAITNLCSRAIWLNKGKLMDDGNSAEVVENYIGSTKQDKNETAWDMAEQAPGNELVKLKSILINPVSEKANTYISVRTPVHIDVEFWCYIENCTLNINVTLLTETGECVFNIGTHNIVAKKGIMVLDTTIPGNLLNNANYTISLTVIKDNASLVYEFVDCASFDVEDIRENMTYFGKWEGIIRPEINSVLYIK